MPYRSELVRGGGAVAASVALCVVLSWTGSAHALDLSCWGTSQHQAAWLIEGNRVDFKFAGGSKPASVVLNIGKPCERRASYPWKIIQEYCPDTLRMSSGWFSIQPSSGQMIFPSLTNNASQRATVRISTSTNDGQYRKACFGVLTYRCTGEEDRVCLTEGYQRTSGFAIEQAAAPTPSPSPSPTPSPAPPTPTGMAAPTPTPTRTPTSCELTVSPTSVEVPDGGDIGEIAVNWTCDSLQDWKYRVLGGGLRLTNKPGKKGDATLVWQMKGTTVERFVQVQVYVPNAPITRYVTFRQYGPDVLPCEEVDVSAATVAFPADGGHFCVDIDAPSACRWIIRDVPSWVGASALQGVGDASVCFDAGENAGKPRDIAASINKRPIRFFQGSTKQAKDFINAMRAFLLDDD